MGGQGTGEGPRVLATGECAADWLAWEDPSRGTFLAIVAKVAFAFTPGGVCALLPPVELVVGDRHRDRSPLRELEAASDAVPFLARPEVLVVGHAFGPGGRATPSLTVHLALGREAVTFRKTVHVFGDREAQGASPSPFRRVPLSWEKAVRTEANPVGVAPPGCPNLVDPVDPSRAAGLGPLASIWGPRRARLGAARRHDLDREPMRLPAGFDGSYFQAAPEDQWLERLVGDEWLSFDGLHPSLPRVQTKLPGLRIGARFEGPRGGRTVELRPDRLLIDADRQRGTLTYRGSSPIEPAELASHRIFVGLALPGSPVLWPDGSDPEAARPHVFGRARVSVVPAANDVLGDTTESISPERANAPPVPFRSPSSPSPSAAPSEDDDDGGTLVADVGAMLAARGGPALPFGGPVGSSSPPPPAPSTAQAPGEDGEFSETAPIDVRGLRARLAPLPFAAAGAPPVESPAAPPAAVAIAPPAFVTAATPVGPGLGLTEETTLDDVVTPHPAQALPFAPTDAGIPLDPQTSAGAAGLPFLAATPPPHVGPLFAPPPSSPAGSSAAPEAAAPAEPAPVRGDGVPSLADGPFALITLPWQIRPPKDCLVVIVKASFDLVEGAAARPRAEPELPLGDVFDGDEPDKPLKRASDFAILKPRCDVLVEGFAHAPGGSAPAMQIALRVKGAGGKIERLVTVFGDRTWQRALIAVAPSDPLPFERIPITWERSFGGPESPANPHGVGYKARPSPDGQLRLPNFETPGHHIKSPDEVPPPAGLGPIHPMWKARWALLGTYDKAWFQERWPYFPKDFDFAHFQSAVPAQRLERAVGDESFELVGLVPGKPKLVGTLPGLKARVFGKKTAAEGAELVEVPLKLDTITFVTEEARVDLVWRGSIDVSDDDAPELERFFVTSEPTAGPALTLEEVKRRYEAALHPPVEEPEAAPTPREEAAEADDEASAEEAAAGAEAQRLEADLAAKEKALLDDLRARGIDVEPPAETPTAAPDPARLAAQMRAAGADEADVAEWLEALKPPPPEDGDAPPPLVDLRRLVTERIARREPLAALDLRRADLRDLDLQGQDLSKSDLTGALLARVRLEGADLSEATLVGADLTQVRALGTSFAGADLTDAILDGAVLEGAKLDLATLAGARGDKTVFRAASAVGTSFVGAQLPGARFDGASLEKADFSRAVLDATVFDGAKMAKVRLYDARGHGTSFVACEMVNARAERSVFIKSSFTSVVADDSVWERAELTTSTFQKASLVSASFVRATCLKTSFNEADLSTARLRKSKMNGATFVKANLFEASLDRADFELADLRGANLHAASLLGVRLTHAKMDHAITSYTTFGRRPS